MTIFPFFSRREARTPLILHNTLGDQSQAFTLPKSVHTVRMYNCGPTVYDRQHIGNLSMFIFADVLRRTLEYNNFAVKQVINITDVGHLTGDNDEGEDKMSKGLAREGLELTLENMQALAEKYTNIFLEDLRALNIDTDRIEFPRASDYIEAQIAMIQTLEEKGYAYRTDDGVYYDTSRFPRYGELGGIDLEGLRAGARVAQTSGKRHPTDFALWKLDQKLGWNSPWGKGFPGWHIECSAMIRKTLGQQIDIHTGGIEHIPIHHNNEIAQSEAATGKHPLSRFWLHRQHIQLEGGKLAKSEGRVIYLSDISARGYHPLALRYLFLGAHYRTPMNFTWDSLDAAQKAFARLIAVRIASESPASAPEAWKREFRERINDDLDTPGALSILWEAVRSDSLSADERAGCIIEADAIFNLGLSEPSDDLRKLAAEGTKQYIDASLLSAEVTDILARRAIARAEKNWSASDTLRDELAALGYGVDDTGDGQRVYKK